MSELIRRNPYCSGQVKLFRIRIGKDGRRPSKEEIKTDIKPDSINNVCFSSLPLKLDDIALEMQNDRILTEVYRAILDEWPGEIVIEVNPY